jgi:Inovirus Coat protein B
MDTAAALTAITAAGVSVGVIGAAVFLVRLGIKGYKWLRSAL